MNSSEQPSQHQWDQPLDRRGTSATKWEKFDPTVLPFWVADMDLPTPDFVLDAIRSRLEHPLLGYTNIPPALNETFVDYLKLRHNWLVDPDWLVWMPGVVGGINIAAQSQAEAGDPLFIMPPVYYPFLDVADNARLQQISVPLLEHGWRMDLDALAKLAQAHPSPRQRTLLLCNPQNPTGRIYSRAELTALGTLCEQEDLLICSDEIHCDLLLDDKLTHTPIASISPELAARTITLMAPTKTYNMPGLGCAVAVIPNARLRSRFRRARQGIVAGPTVLGMAAAIAAYQQDGAWIDRLCDYLRGNCERLAAVAGERMVRPEATYLGWLDMRDLKAHAPERSLEAYFVDHGLGLTDGATFGAPGYARFNFGCSRTLLDAGLERLEAALANVPG